MKEKEKKQRRGLGGRNPVINMRRFDQCRKIIQIIHQLSGLHKPYFFKKKNLQNKVQRVKRCFQGMNFLVYLSILPD